MTHGGGVATLESMADDETPDEDDRPPLEYSNELARRAAKATGSKTHPPKPPTVSPN